MDSWKNATLAQLEGLLSQLPLSTLKASQLEGFSPSCGLKTCDVGSVLHGLELAPRRVYTLQASADARANARGKR